MRNSCRKVLSIVCAISLLLSSVPFYAYSEGEQTPSELLTEQENALPESTQEVILPEEAEIENVTIQQVVQANYVIDIPQVLNKTTWSLKEDKEARREHVVRIKAERDIDLFFLLTTDADADAVISTEENESRKKFTRTDESEIAAIAGESGSHYVLKGVHIEADGSRLIRIRSNTPVKFRMQVMTGSAWQKLNEVRSEEETAEAVEETTPEAEKPEEVPPQEPANKEDREESVEIADTPVENKDLSVENEEPADEKQEAPAEEIQEVPVQEPAEEETDEEPVENTDIPVENEEPVEEPADEKQETPAEETQEEPAQEAAEEETDEEPVENTDVENTGIPMENEEPVEEPADEKQETPAEERQEEPAQEAAEEETDEEPMEKLDVENTDLPVDNEEPADEKQETSAEETQEEPVQEPAEEETDEEPVEIQDVESADPPVENEKPIEELVDENQKKPAEETQEEPMQESAEEETDEEPVENLDVENTDLPVDNEEPAEEPADEQQEALAEETQEEPVQESAEEETDEEPVENRDEENTDLPVENDEPADENKEEPAEENQEEPAEEAEAEPEEDEFWEAVISEHIDDYTVTVTIPKEAEFPIGTTVKITPLNSAEYRNDAAGIFDKNENELGAFIRVFDITFYYEDMEIEPLVPIDVKITFDNAVQLEGENELKLIHLHEEEEAREIVVEAQTTEVETGEGENEGEENTQTVTNVESLSFQSGQFSTYIVAEEVVVYTFTDSGKDYEVILKYNAGANMPEDAVFSVEEITEDSPLYEQYRAQVAAVINPDGSVRMPALLDISLKRENGEKIQLGNKVQVIVRLTGEESLEKNLKVVHFPGEDPFQGESAVRDAVAENGEYANIEVLDIDSEKLYGRVNTAENTVTFSTDSFSVFALAYSVDFHYGEYEYNMEIGGEIKLSELFSMLSILYDPLDVDRIECSDSSLLKAEPYTDDWKLTSLKSFDTPVTVTLYIKDKDPILLQMECSELAFKVVVNNHNKGSFTSGYFSGNKGNYSVKKSTIGTGSGIGNDFVANEKDTSWHFVFWLAVYPDKSTKIIYGNTLPASTPIWEDGTTTFIACFAPNNAKLTGFVDPQNVNDISYNHDDTVTLAGDNVRKAHFFYFTDDYTITATLHASSGSALFRGWYEGNTLIKSDVCFKYSDSEDLYRDIILTPVYGDVFVSKIKFFDINSTINEKTDDSPMHVTGTLAAPTLTKYYYLLAVLKDNAGHELGWAVNPVALNGKAETTTGFYSFHQFEETPGSGGKGSDTSTPTLLYTSGNQVETRLYNTDSALPTSNQTYAYLKSNASEYPETGYEFGGNFINDSGENEIHLKAAPAVKKYLVRVYFDEEAATAFTEGDRYYVNVKVSHESTVDNFQGAQLTTDLSSLPTDSNGNRYVEFDFTNWQNGDGSASSSVFTGYERSILVELIHQTQNAYKPNYDSNDAAPVPEGTLAKSYRIHYDTKQTNPKSTPSGFYEDRTTEHVYCYDYINLTTINATSDYNYNTILGPNMGYGIVADHLYQGNDLQTNFAVNHYSAHGHYVSPDLSGKSSGAIVIGEFNLVDGMATNGIGAVSYDDVWGKLPIGKVLGNTLIVYADEDTGFNAPDGNVSNYEGKNVVVVHTDGEELKASMVQPGINYGISMSNALMSHPDTFTPPITSTTKATLDTTGFADGTTIYIDGDLYADILKTGGGLTILKRENQTIVFNFDTTKDLEINQFKVQYLKADGTFTPVITTSTDTSNGTEQNKIMDILSRHLIWNLNGVKGKTTINIAGGIFLQPNRNSEIDISGTSGGWIVSNGFVYNSNGEWHNYYIDMPDTNKLNLRAVKTVDGKIPRAGQQFEFFLDEYDTTVEGNWRRIETKGNTNANVVFTQMSDLSAGWHVFRIHENTTVPSGEGIEAGLYIIDQTTYYAVAHVTITNDASGVRYIITPPVYYKGLGNDGHFDSSKFSVENGPQEGAFGEKVTAATFNNEAVKQGLTIEKKVEGTTDTTKRFTFEVELRDGSEQFLAGPYDYTVTNVSGTKTLTLENGKGTIVLRNGQKATITGLPVGTQYVITEKMVDDVAITVANQDNVNGYDTPDESVTGTIASAAAVSIARFTNVYHANGTATVKAKKTLNNGTLQANQFKFTLTPLNSADSTVLEAYNDANGDVTFTPSLSFTEEDMTGAFVLPNGSRVKLLMYYVSESDGTLEGFNYGNVTYDSTKILIITLTDDGKGNITASSLPDSFTVNFVNDYELKAPGTLEGNKKLTGRDMAANEFAFTARLYKFTHGDTNENYDTNETMEVSANQTDEHGNQLTKTVSNPNYQTSAHGTPTKLTAKNTAATEGVSSSFSFPTIYYMDPGVYYYQITENIGLGELPMGVSAKDSSKIYYAKMTVPEVEGRTENSVSTVEYYSDAECNNSINKTAVLFENEWENISFNVTKDWTDQNGAAKNDGYSIVFSVKQNGRAYPVTADHLEIVSGTNSQAEILADGTVRLTGNENGWPVVKIKKLPVATYTVTETVMTAADGDTGTYSTTYTVGGSTTSNFATIMEDDSSVTIRNTMGNDRYTSITVEKKWKAGETEYTPDSGSVTFRLTKKETRQSEVATGRTIGVALDGSTTTSTVHVGNTLLVSFTVGFGSKDAKKAFYNQYGNHKLNGVGYAKDSENFNGDCVGSRQTIYLPQPCPLSSDEINAINDSDDIIITFKVPTTGVVNGNTINSEELGGIKIYGYQFDNVSSVSFHGFSEEAAYQTVTNTTTSTFTVDAANGWSTVLSGLPLSKSNPVTSYKYTVEEISVNGTDLAESPFMVTYNDHEDIIGGTVVATNTREEITVSVTKKWYKLQSDGNKLAAGETSWPDGISSVRVKIQKKAADNTISDLATPTFYTSAENTGSLVWSDTLDLTSAEGSKTWHHLDELQAGESYVVTELSVAVGETNYSVSGGQVTVGGKTYDVSVSPVSNKSATVTNSERKSIEFEKVWDASAQTVTFEVPEGATVVDSSKVDSGWITLSKDELIVRGRLHRYDMDGDTRLTTYDFAASDTTADAELTNGTWTKIWADLPATGTDDSGNRVDYVYEVEETMVTVATTIMHNGSGGQVDLKSLFDATTVVSDGKITMTNSFSDDHYSLEVSKVWKNANGDLIPSQGNIQFKLIRHAEVPSSDPATIKVVNKWNSDTVIYNTKTGYSVGDTVSLSFPTNAYFHPWELEGATFISQDWKQNGEVTQSCSFIITSGNVCLKIGDGGVTNETPFTYNLVSGGVSNSSGDSVLKPASGSGYEVDTTGNYLFTLVAGETKRFRDLPLNDGSGTSYTYEIQEVNPGSCTVSYSPSAIYNPDTNSDGVGENGSIVITNQITVRSISINVTKLWQGGPQKTTGASIGFTLYQKLTADGHDTINAPYTDYTNTTAGIASGVGSISYNGTEWAVVNIPNLPMTVTVSEGGDAITYNASYYVIETSVTADAGYLLTTQYSTDGGTNVVSDGCDAAVSTDGSTITIVNTETAGIELPSTGGHGTMGYTLAGLAMALLAGIFLLMGRKRKVDG